MSTDFHPDILLATARLQEYLLVLPRVVGPRQAWVEWIRAEVREELVRL